MPIRIGKVSLGEEIAMLKDLEKTLRIAIAKATLIADSTGDDETHVEMRAMGQGGYLSGALDRTRLAIYRAQGMADEQIDDMVAMERGDDEAVSMDEYVSLNEDLGR